MINQQTRLWYFVAGPIFQIEIVNRDNEAENHNGRRSRID